MLRRLVNFVRNQQGVTPVEYALIAAIITVATTFAVSAAGYNITDILG
ncbi:Flp family type IVb pilin [Devosia honganensis]|uniref:Flp family type IVb pilin n=1 Tax=Devosia honganensis TaxID=1610527 RepID=A0ABV7X0N8_9HYPH